MNSLIPPDRSPPSTASIALATAIIAAVGGYFIGQAASLGVFSSTSSTKNKRTTKKSWPNSYDVNIHPDSSDEELMAQLKGEKPAGSKEVADSEEDSGASEGDEDDIGELKTFEKSREEFKLVLCVRSDLGMGRGIRESYTRICEAYKNTDTSKQAKLLHNARMPPCRITKPCFLRKEGHLRLFSNDGNLTVKQKLLCKSVARISLRSCRLAR